MLLSIYKIFFLLDCIVYACWGTPWKKFLKLHCICVSILVFNWVSPSTWVVDLDGGDSWIIIEMNIVMIGCGGVFHVECQLLLEFNLHGSGSNNIIFMATQYWPQISGIFFSCLCNSHLKFKPLLHLIELISMDWSLRL